MNERDQMVAGALFLIGVHSCDKLFVFRECHYDNVFLIHGQFVVAIVFVVGFVVVAVDGRNARSF